MTALSFSRSRPASLALVFSACVTVCSGSVFAAPVPDGSGTGAPTTTEPPAATAAAAEKKTDAVEKAKDEPAYRLPKENTLETPDQATVHWSRWWPRFRTEEYIETGGLLLAGAAAYLFLPDPGRKWKAGILFDQAGIDVLRSTSASGRQSAQTLSDYLFFGTMGVGFFADPLLALTVHRDPDVAYQLFLINTESFAFTNFVQVLASRIAGRERPYVRNCKANGDTTSYPCFEDTGSATSFVSGHTAMAATGAGLICAHHQKLPLYGGGIADNFACVVAMGSALTTGLMRVVADKHNTSDVVLGFGLGFISGYVLPLLRHYQQPSSHPSNKLTGMRVVPAPMLSPSTLGLGALAIF